MEEVVRRSPARPQTGASSGAIIGTMDPDWLTLGAVVAVGGLLWRALGSRIDDVGRRVDTLANDVKTLDRRVARLEGWLERDRLGAAVGTSPPATS